ncbi:RNA recognition motif domain-containing protein [Flavisolibacter tropicus]|uniref:RNA-binding protein n=1 Tax=Flavisolibacter tropicus TaxID=1492898 RepID=A0A172TVB9_9BACT|nr:RNA-binding protein [Flavisolibacter tropicus]ANE50918.1 RNA-binding protein [Flavisolibacter tropicus]
MNLYVSNLSLNTTDEALKSAFSSYGQVESAKVILDRFTGKSRGFGFVEMPDKQEAGNAITELNNGIVDGSAISVVEARPREERPERSNNFRDDSSSYNKSRW